MRPILLVVNSLGFGGVTTAVLDQARMFVERGHHTTIVSFIDSPQEAERVEELRRLGRLDPRVDVRNIHAELRATTPARSKARRGVAAVSGAAQQVWKAVSTSTYFTHDGEDKFGRYTREFDRLGNYLSFVRWSAEGTRSHVNYFQGRQHVRREEFASSGIAYRSTELDPVTGTPIQERYFADDGYCYLVRWVDPKTGKGQGVFAADRHTRTMQRFSGIPAWHAAWLGTLVAASSGRPILIANSPSAAPKVARVSASLADRYAMYHNNHFAEPFEVGSPVRPDHSDVFESLATLDGLVLLTAQQKHDVEALFGHGDKIHVIPNAIRVPAVGSAETDTRLVSIVSRLAPQKALHEAIHAFETVVSRVPHARLEIYGSGPEHHTLQQLITTLGLTKHVTLKGRTDAPAQIMARSLCTVSTSNWEALPLSIAESQSVGTPVVAYDCLYGPAALIADGQTGRLVPRGDRDGLAHAIIDLLNDPPEAARLGAAARESVHRQYTYEPVYAAWITLFKGDAQH